jgi:hypothetical protein
MFPPYPFSPCHWWMFILTLLLFLIGLSAYTQTTNLPGKDSSAKTLSPLTPDTMSRSLKSFLDQERQQFKNSILHPKKDSFHLENPFGGGKNAIRIQERPVFFKFTGGYVGYNFSYRSDADTPYTEKDISQHQVISSLNFTIAGMIPIRVNGFIRRSNSSVFQDITDMQVAFDAAAYRNRVSSLMKGQLLKQTSGIDSMTGKLYNIKRLQTDNLGNWLKDRLTSQKLIEANEILKVPKLTYDMHKSDTANKTHEDSLRKAARKFLELYKRTKGEYDSLNRQADSLKKEYQRAIDQERQYRQVVNGKLAGMTSYDAWKKELARFGPGAADVPEKYRWLLGVRNFGLGRNNLNSSELTAKNCSLNGVNFEYNSWYYMAFSAGLVDYRFRDFVVGHLNRTPQYMYLARIGLGRLEKNYFIVSFFGGRKQLLNYSPGVNTTTSFNLTGLSLETKWTLLPGTYMIAELAESFSPDLQGGLTPVKPGWDLSDKNNKALSLKLYSSLPATGTRLEGQYKFTGANFQSFNSFQTNSELRSWYVKGEQSLLSHQLKLVASVRSNDFSNPYIIQDYKANTVFTSVNATLHVKHWPSISIGYMPMSQITMVGTQLEESRFETLKASISHFYKLGQRSASTNIVYTKFFNSSSDTGFIYYNSVNLFAGQTIFFRDFTATVSLTHSQSSGYLYNVLGGDISFPVTKRASLGIGAKLNDLDQTLTGVGGFVNANFLIGRGDRLFFHVEKGYLPGSGTASKLVPNVLGNISYTKMFR